MPWIYKDWYEDNKRELSERRKKRYRQDPEYRKKARDNAKRYYNKKTGGGPKSRTIFTQKGERYFSIGELSKRIGKSIQTIREYHRFGVIPISFSDNRGWRLYNESQVILMERIFRQFDEKKIKSLKQVSEILDKEWD